MSRHVLLLRGVNVGAKNALPMADLRAILAGIGCTDVTTYVQSGNAVLTTSLSRARLIAAAEAALSARMGRPIAVTTRTLVELTAIIAGDPFQGLPGEPRHRCVTFLETAPSAAALASVVGRDWEPERVQIIGREIYSLYPAGQARSPLATALGKLKLAVATARNWNTVLAIRDLLASQGNISPRPARARGEAP